MLDKFSKYFEGLTIEPALIHGDIHGRNVADTTDGPGSVEAI